MPESFGLGAALVVAGNTVLTSCLVVPDDLAESDPHAYADLLGWAARQRPGEIAGPWRVVRLSEFFDPLATVEAQPWAFQPNAYSGAGFVVGADLGRTFGLCAEHCAPRRGRGHGSWELWLPGWGVGYEDGYRRRSPHRPPLRATARRVGWQVEFGPCGSDAHGKTAGKLHRGRAWRGAFVDLLSLAYALDADRGASFVEHCENLEVVSGAELPLAVIVDETGADQVAEAAQVLYRLALRLDDEAGRWFTTPQDRREGRGRLELSRMASPGALAAQIPTRFGLTAPLSRPVDDLDYRRWAEADHGGWNDVDRRLLGTPFPAVSADVTSCYPLVAHLLGWWDLMCAERVRRDDVTEALRRLCARAATDPTVVLCPDLWRRFEATLVEVVPDGERFPVAIEDVHRPDGRMEVVPLTSPGRAMFYAWPDVVSAAVLSGRVPRILSATRYSPRGRQVKMRRRVPLLPGLVLHA